jgi:hypothetical protein
VDLQICILCILQIQPENFAICTSGPGRGWKNDPGHPQAERQIPIFEKLFVIIVKYIISIFSFHSLNLHPHAGIIPPTAGSRSS